MEGGKRRVMVYYKRTSFEHTPRFCNRYRRLKMRSGIFFGREE